MIGRNAMSSMELELEISDDAEIGQRPSQEDRHSTIRGVRTSTFGFEYSHLMFFGVYDGHGGEHAAEYANQHLFNNIVTNDLFCSEEDDSVLQAIRDGFSKTQRDMENEYQNWPRKRSGCFSSCGTTATIGFIKNYKLYIGHVGDSALVLGSQETGSNNWTPTYLTKFHRPSDPEERERILRCNGRIMANSIGIERVGFWVPPPGRQLGDPRVNTNVALSMTRALGNFWSYMPRSREFLISPDPDCSVVELNDTHKCLIFATDGLWDKVSSTTAVQFVQRNVGLTAEERQQLGGEDQMNISRQLIRNAMSNWQQDQQHADNISVITVVFKHAAVSASVGPTSMANKVAKKVLAKKVPVKRGRGRPRKYAVKPAELNGAGVSRAAKQNGRGRPRNACPTTRNGPARRKTGTAKMIPASTRVLRSANKNSN